MPECRFLSRLNTLSHPSRGRETVAPKQPGTRTALLTHQVWRRRNRCDPCNWTLAVHARGARRSVLAGRAGGPHRSVLAVHARGALRALSARSASLTLGARGAYLSLRSGRTSNALRPDGSDGA